MALVRSTSIPVPGLASTNNLHVPCVRLGGGLYAAARRAPYVKDVGSLAPAICPAPASTLISLGRQPFTSLPAAVPGVNPAGCEAAFRLQLEVGEFVTTVGEQLAVVGSTPGLGSWDAAKAVRLAWSPGHRHAVDIPIPHAWEGIVEFKLVLLGSDGKVQWEPGPNRKIDIAHSPSATSEQPSVGMTWGKAAGPVLVAFPSAAAHDDDASKSSADGMSLIGCKVVVAPGATQPGQRLALVGSCAQLGSWNVKNAAELVRADDDSFQGLLQLPACACLEAKLVVLDEKGVAVRWEKGDNRVVQLQPACAAETSCEVRCTFNRTSDTAVSFSALGDLPGHYQLQSASSGSSGAAPPLPVVEAAAPRVRCLLQVPNLPTAPGQHLLIAGSAPELGSWDVTKAPKLEAKEGGLHEVAVDLLAVDGVEAKVVLWDGKKHSWEKGLNRKIDLATAVRGSQPGSAAVITCDWGRTAATDILVVQPAISTAIIAEHFVDSAADVAARLSSQSSDQAVLSGDSEEQQSVIVSLPKSACMSTMELLDLTELAAAGAVEAEPCFVPEEQLIEPARLAAADVELLAQELPVAPAAAVAPAADAHLTQAEAAAVPSATISGPEPQLPDPLLHGDNNVPPASFALAGDISGAGEQLERVREIADMEQQHVAPAAPAAEGIEMQLQEVQPQVQEEVTQLQAEPTPGLEDTTTIVAQQVEQEPEEQQLQPNAVSAEGVQLQQAEPAVAAAPIDVPGMFLQPAEEHPEPTVAVAEVPEAISVEVPVTAVAEPAEPASRGESPAEPLQTEPVVAAVEQQAKQVLPEPVTAVAEPAEAASRGESPAESLQTEPVVAAVEQVEQVLPQPVSAEAEAAGVASQLPEQLPVEPFTAVAEAAAAAGADVQQQSEQPAPQPVVTQAAETQEPVLAVAPEVPEPIIPRVQLPEQLQEEGQQLEVLGLSEGPAAVDTSSLEQQHASSAAFADASVGLSEAPVPAEQPETVTVVEAVYLGRMDELHTHAKEPAQQPAEQAVAAAAASDKILVSHPLADILDAEEDVAQPGSQLQQVQALDAAAQFSKMAPQVNQLVLQSQDQQQQAAAAAVEERVLEEERLIAARQQQLQEQAGENGPDGGQLQGPELSRLASMSVKAMATSPVDGALEQQPSLSAPAPVAPVAVEAAPAAAPAPRRRGRAASMTPARGVTPGADSAPAAPAAAPEAAPAGKGRRRTSLRRTPSMSPSPAPASGVAEQLSAAAGGPVEISGPPTTPASVEISAATKPKPKGKGKGRGRSVSAATEYKGFGRP